MAEFKIQPGKLDVNSGAAALQEPAFKIQGGGQLQPGTGAGAEIRTLEDAARERQAARQAAARANLDQGPPVPADVRDQERGRLAREEQNRVLMGNPAIAAAVMASQGTRVNVPRKAYPAEQRFLGETLGGWRRNELTGAMERAPGTLERSESATREVMNEEQVMADIYAQEFRKQETEAKARDDAMLANAQRRMEIQRAQAEGVRDQAVGLTTAVDAMEKSPDLGSWWQSRTAGQKTWAVISAVLLRMTGSDPMAAINASIAEEQEVAKFNFRKRAEVVQGRQQEQAAQMNVYNVLAQHAQSEEELDAMARYAYWENAKRRMQRMAAEGQSRLLPHQQEQLMANFEQEQAKQRLQLEYMRAKSTPTRSVRVNTYPGMVRKAIVKEGAAQADFGRDMRKEAYKGQVEIEKERAKGEAEGFGDKNIETDTRYNSAKAGVGLIDEMLKLSEQTGGGEPGRFGPVKAGLLGDADPMVSQEARDFRQMQTDLEGILQEAYGGASPTPAQEEAAHVDTGMAAGSGGQSVQALKRTRERLMRQIEDAERRLGEGHRKHRARNENLPSAETEWSSGSMPDSYEPE